MPRSMSEKYDEAFRIAATTSGVRDDGTKWSRTSYYGPYATKSAAKGQITGLRYEHDRNHYYAPPATTFEAHIEKSSASWERVE